MKGSNLLNTLHFKTISVVTGIVVGTLTVTVPIIVWAARLPNNNDLGEIKQLTKEVLIKVDANTDSLKALRKDININSSIAQEYYKENKVQHRILATTLVDLTKQVKSGDSLFKTLIRLAPLYSYQDTFKKKERHTGYLIPLL